MVYHSRITVFSGLTVSPEEATYAAADVVLTVSKDVVSIKENSSTLSTASYTTASGSVTLLKTYLDTIDEGWYFYDLYDADGATVRFELEVEG
jgi:uncharacterized protein YcfL